jgi:hypothetical protein
MADRTGDVPDAADEQPFSKGSAMTQPTEHEDEFNEILAAAYAALMQMPVKPETYESYVRAEMADHLDVPQPQD